MWILSAPGMSRVSCMGTHLWDPTHIGLLASERQLRSRVSRRTIRGRDQRATGETVGRRISRAASLPPPPALRMGGIGGSPASPTGERGAVTAETPWPTPGVIQFTRPVQCTELRRHARAGYNCMRHLESGAHAAVPRPDQTRPPPERKATQFSRKDTMECVWCIHTRNDLLEATTFQSERADQILAPTYMRTSAAAYNTR